MTHTTPVIQQIKKEPVFKWWTRLGWNSQWRELNHQLTSLVVRNQDNSNPDPPCWSTKLIHRVDPSSWSTKLIYQIDLPSWPSQLTHQVDLPNWSTKLIYQVDPPSWPTKLIYQMNPPTWSTKLIHRVDPPSWSISTMQFSISTQFSTTWSIDRTL